MRFERCQVWRVSFQDLDNNRTNFREFTFDDSGKIEELVARTATKMMSEDRQAFEQASAWDAVPSGSTSPPCSTPNSSRILVYG
jgi:hypothetical protein